MAKDRFTIFLAIIALAVTLELFVFGEIFQVAIAYTTYIFTTGKALPPQTNFMYALMIVLANISLLVIILLLTLRDGGIKGISDGKLLGTLVSIGMNVIAIVFLLNAIFIFIAYGTIAVILPMIIVALAGYQVIVKHWDKNLILLMAALSLIFLVALALAGNVFGIGASLNAFLKSIGVPFLNVAFLGSIIGLPVLWRAIRGVPALILKLWAMTLVLAWASTRYLAMKQIRHKTASEHAQSPASLAWRACERALQSDWRFGFGYGYRLDSPSSFKAGVSLSLSQLSQEPQAKACGLEE